MVNLLINNSKIKLKTEWSDMVLSDAIAIHTILHEHLPSKLRMIYELNVQNRELNKPQIDEIIKSITDEENFILIPTFMGKLIQYLSGCTDDVLNSLTSGQRSSIYNFYLIQLVYETLFFPNFELTGIKYFKFKGVKYYLPVTEDGIGDVKVPMADRTAIEFTESADLEANTAANAAGRFSTAANIIAILCRPKLETGEIEPYNQRTVLDRAKIFLDLPMEIVFEVFFCCIGQLISLKKQGRIFSREVQEVQSKNTIMDGMRSLSRWRKRVYVAR